ESAVARAVVDDDDLEIVLRHVAGRQGSQILHKHVAAVVGRNDHACREPGLLGHVLLLMRIRPRRFVSIVHRALGDQAAGAKLPCTRYYISVTIATRFSRSRMCAM